MCHISGTMQRLRALVAVFHLAAIALVAPMLVLCEDGEHHAAVESVTALCCSDRHADVSDAPRPSKSAGAGANDCSGSCTDTPLLTSIAATFPKGIARADGAAALSRSLVVASAPLALPAEAGSRFSGSLPPPHLVRSTVLRV
jgi:hypothetical protein